MKKYDLADCSIIIPIHIDCSERIEHLYFLLHYFRKFFINYEIIIVEQGKEQKISSTYQKRAHIEFIESDEEFSTSRICNIGATLVKTPFFCKCDTDAVIHPKAFFDAFEVLKSNSLISLVAPYNGISFTLKNPFRQDLLTSFDFITLPFVTPAEIAYFNSPCICLKSDDSMGLIHHFRTSVFKALGGYNEEFIGWGYEDNEILVRFKTLGHPKAILEGYNGFHLEHPRMEGSKFHLLKNIHKLQLVENMSADQLTEYIKSWTRF